MSQLTVLSFGAGQDSTAILYRLIYDKDFRKRYAPNHLIVVMAETGNEHEETYAHVEKVKKTCEKHDIEFYHLDYQYTPAGWKGGLIKFYERTSSIGSKAFPKTCTDKLKIQAIYAFLEHFVHTRYSTRKFGRKQALLEFSEKYGKIDVLIGISRGEEKRMCSNESSLHVWMRKSVNKVYPLIELGMDREDCQRDIEVWGHEVPLPSNCIICPFMSMQELLYLYYFHPEWYHKWVRIEQAKIEKNLHMGDKNLGIWGKKLLPEVLEEAKLKYGDMTLTDLREYKMSHGHCVASKY